MASLSDVQRFLRQKRATGRLSPGEMQEAYEAYFAAEAGKTLERSKFALDKRRLDVSERQQEDQLDMFREQQEQAEDAAKISGITELGKFGLMAADTEIGKKVISGGQKAVTSLFDTGASSATGAAIGSTAGTAFSGTASAGTGISPAAMTGTSPMVASSVGSSAGTIMGAAGASIAGAATGFVADKAFGKDFKEVGGAVGGATTGFMIGGPVGAVIGGVIGFGVDAISDETWLCTETKKLVGLSNDEQRIIGEFREFVLDEYPGWLRSYIQIGNELVQAIDGDAEFYSNLKKELIDPVISLTDKKHYHSAYKIYKDKVLELVREYAPELELQAPQEVN